MTEPNLQGTLYLQGQTFDVVSFDKDSFVMHWSMEAGDSVGTHIHDKVDEHLQMLQGTLEFKMNGKREVRTTGEEILIPAHLVHSIHNVSGGTARCVMIWKKRLRFFFHCARIICLIFLLISILPVV